METTDLLGLGDSQPAPPPIGMKRDRDSLDDFEHLEEEQHSREADLLQPSVVAPPKPDFVSDLHNFLESERETRTFPHKLSDSDDEPSSGLPHRTAPPVPPHAPGAFDVEPSPPISVPIRESPPLPLHQQEPSPPPVPQREPSPPSLPQREPSPPSLPQREPSPPSLPQREPSPPLRAMPAYPTRPLERPPAPPVKLETPKRTAHVIEAEVIFCQMGLDAWFNPERLHPRVESLIYWRDPVKSGVALGAGLALLVALACCSVVSVLAYASLLVLCGTVAFRIYKNILQAVQKTSEGHPFKWLLDADISLPADRSQQIAAAATAHANAAANQLRSLFLVEDLIDSLKFIVVLWSLTYVGAWFNGITLIILSYVALFTLPKAYEANKAQVDANLELARAKINDITAKVRAAVPLGKKEGDKDK